MSEMPSVSLLLKKTYCFFNQCHKLLKTQLPKAVERLHFNLTSAFLTGLDTYFHGISWLLSSKMQMFPQYVKLGSNVKVTRNLKSFLDDFLIFMIRVFCFFLTKDLKTGMGKIIV